MIENNLESSISDAQPKRLGDESVSATQPFSQRAHAFVDRATEALGSSSERLSQLHQQYGDKAREQVRAKPLAAVGVALAVGLVVSKLFSR